MRFLKGFILILLLIISIAALSLIYFKGIEGTLKLYEELSHPQPKQAFRPIEIEDKPYTLPNPKLEEIEKEIALIQAKHKKSNPLNLKRWSKRDYILPNIARFRHLHSHLAHPINPFFKLPSPQKPHIDTLVLANAQKAPKPKMNQIIVKESQPEPTAQPTSTPKPLIAPKKLLVNVDLSSQRMKVYKNGKLLYHWKVSTGRRGYSTPVGKYKPKYLSKMHYSRKYDNSPMPYSIFFHGGYACHGTKSIWRLGRKASHGCVRLHPTNAKKLYYLVQNVGKANSTIRITP